MQQEYRQHNFVLTELIVVLMALAIMTGIACSAWNHARSKAKEVLCLEHQQAVGKAISAYCADNHETLAMWGYVYKIAGNARGLNWDKWNKNTETANYIGDRNQLRCPSEIPFENWSLGTYYNHAWNYAYGAFIKSAFQPGLPKEKTSGKYNRNALVITKLKNPADFFLVADSITFHPLFYWKGSFPQYAELWGPQDRNFMIHLRHHGKANILLADGHSEGMDDNQIQINTASQKYTLNIH